MNTENRVAIMQPYFLPYLGYWQLMHNVNVFVIYDDIKYTKKGWINRNRFLLNGKPETFTLPLHKDSDSLDISQRRLADNFREDKTKFIRRVEAAYKNAPYFGESSKLLSSIISCESNNLFEFIYNSINIIKSALQINSSIVVSSSLNISRELKGQDRVIATCHAVHGTHYINPIGGTLLYRKEDFKEAGIHLSFQNVRPIHYKQFDFPFIANLSILDVLMFCGTEKTKQLLGEMDLC